MWSGPRNISTAMMRSFGARSDTHVTDEPFYATYLRNTDVDHPGRDEILEAYPEDWKSVARWLTGPVPQGKAIWYQKHMTHHILPGMEREWMDELDHAFLIRDPAAVIASFSKVIPDPDESDIGLEQQVEIFEGVRSRAGRIPPVIDADDVLADPEGVLRLLCRALEIEFEPSMLRWEPGPRPTDGIWAKYWYESVNQSTGFQPARNRTIELSPSLRELEATCRPYYETMAAQRLGV